MKKSYLIVFFLHLLTSPIASLAQNLELGADRMDILVPMLQNKKVALVVNQTSCLSKGSHLLDELLKEKVKVMKIFAPEHGFRGNADAGEQIKNGSDPKTGIALVSLYGNKNKPTAQELAEIDVVIFDIQDVGTRFYTYISTMHYVMEACAENKKTCIILDRPNPNDYVDGPILKPQFKSFVGMHQIPVLHGLTVGELAQMINGESWLRRGLKCDLRIIPMKGWKHNQPYPIPIAPSPNLPNDQAIKLYPSLCFFEGTDISVGRGTEYPFQIVGAPNPKYGSFSFSPAPAFGSKHPPQNGKRCYGLDLREINFKGGLSLEFLFHFYEKTADKSKFISNPKFFDLLAGSSDLHQQIVRGDSEKEIRESWTSDLNKYRVMRKKYLLYPEDK